MRFHFLLTGVLVLTAANANTGLAAAQTPAIAGQAGAAARQPPPKPAAPAAAARNARASLEIQVTDRLGAPLADVHVAASGAADRDGTTDAEGILRLTNLRPGTYRLRFEHGSYTTFERDATITATTRSAAMDVALTAAPPPPPPVVIAAPTPPPPPPQRREPERPVGDARTVQVPAFLDSNVIGRTEPQKLSIVGCTGYATTRVLQLRDPMTDRSNPDADETLYVVAGEATLRLDGIDRPLEPAALAVIPRGTTHSLVRRGRNPAVIVSVLSGPPCPNLASK